MDKIQRFPAKDAKEKVARELEAFAQRVREGEEGAGGILIVAAREDTRLDAYGFYPREEGNGWVLIGGLEDLKFKILSELD